MWRFISLRKHTTLLAFGVKRSSVPQCAVLSCCRSISSQSKNIETKLHINQIVVNDFVQAAKKNEVDKVWKMLQETLRLVNETNENNAPALIEASRCGNLSIACLLLENGADINAKDKDGWTALMHASNEGRTEIAELLLLKGADVNAKNTNEKTALILASDMGHTEIVLFLLLIGADVNAKDEDGWTALMMASSYNHRRIVEILLLKGADINAKDKDGSTALMLACNEGAVQTVQFLIEKGADVNIKSKRGSTALMNASIEGHTTIVQLLLDKGADVNAKLKGGETALLMASGNGNTQVVRLLLDKGADVNNSKNKDGKTALDMAEIDDIHSLHREAAIALLEKHLATFQRNEREHIPEDFLCPISCDIMEDPVICSDGHSYERGAIEHWLQHHDTSPKTNMRLPNKNLIPNIALQRIIENFSERMIARK